MRLRTRVYSVGLLLLWSVLWTNRLFAAELFVIEQDYCPYCEKFNREIAEAYPKTDEGKRAPLKRLKLGVPYPVPYQHLKPATVTPTFILVHNETEVDRLVGYPGDEYFWFLLGEMLEKLPLD